MKLAIEMQTVSYTDITREHLADMAQWAVEKFGRNALWRQQVERGTARWFYSMNIPRSENTGSAKFVFKNNEDATLFALRWSSKGENYG